MGDVNSCFAKITEAVGSKVDAKSVKQVLADLDEIKTSTGTAMEYSQAANDYLNRVRKDLALNRISKIENEIKTRMNIKQFDDIKVDALQDPVDYLLGVLDGSSRSYKGAGVSISKSTLANDMRVKQMLADGLDDAGLITVAQKGTLDKEIFQYIMEGKKVSAEAKAIADIYMKVDDELVTMAQGAGSFKKKLRDRVIRRNYSSKKVLAEGRDNFVEFVRENWNGKRGKVMDKEALTEVYQDIITGDYDKKLTKELGSPNIDSKNLKSRVIHLKDGASEFEFTQRFSEGGIFSGVMQNISGTARDAAVFAKLGTNPETSWNQLVKHVNRTLTLAEGSEKKLNKLSGSAAKIDTVFDLAVYGPRGGGSTMARMGAGLRALTQMTKLGKATFIAFPTDIAVAAANFKNVSGKGWLSSIADSTMATLKNISPAQRKLVAKKMGVFHENTLADFHSRFQAGDHVGGALGKAQDMFFRLNLMATQTAAQKTATYVEFGSILGTNAGKHFDALDGAFRNELNRYSIDAFDWGNLGKATDDINGTRVISPTALDSVELDVPKGFTEVQYRRDLKTKLSSYFVDNAETGSPTPGLREQSTFQGVSPDTVAGQAIRMMGQFKTFPITMGRVMTKLALADEAAAGMTLRQVLADSSTRAGAMKRLAGAITGLTVAAYLGDSMQQLAVGKTPKDASDPKVMADMFIKGGAMGLYGDFMFSEYDKRYKSLAEDILGPVFGGTFKSASEVWSGVVHGRPKAKTAMKLLIDNTPGANLFFLQGGLDHFILNDIKESLSPGYMSRKRSALQETGQTYLLGD